MFFPVEVSARDLSSWRSNVCFEVAATTLLFYDYFMTLGDEFRCVWKRKFSGVSVLFFVARYSTLLDRGVKMVQLVSWYNYSEDTVVKICKIMGQIDSVVQVLIALVLAVLTVFRVYALWPKMHTFAVIVFLVGMVNPCLTIYYNLHVRTSPQSPPLTGCTTTVTFSDSAMGDIIQDIEFTFTLVAECALLILTWVKTRIARQILVQANVGSPLTRLLLRDGTLYFILCAISAVVTMSNWHNFNFSALATPILTICLCRLFMDLRQTYLSDGVDTVDASNISTSIHFMAQVTGNIGAAVRDTSLREDWDDEDHDTIQFSHDPILTGLTMTSDAPSTSISRDL